MAMGKLVKYSTRKKSKAEQALRIAKQVRKRMPLVQRMKTYQGSNEYNPAGVLTHMTSIATGDDEDTRDGNSIRLSRIEFKYVAKLHASGTAAAVRIIIFRDTQQLTDSHPTASQVLQTTGATLPDQSVTSFMHPDFGRRFAVKYEKVITLSDAGAELKYGYKSIKLGTNVEFNGSLGTDIQRGGYYLLILSTDNTYAPTVSYQYRLHWDD